VEINKIVEEASEVTGKYNTRVCSGVNETLRGRRYIMNVCWNIVFFSHQPILV
jgi:hypothetical protein